MNWKLAVAQARIRRERDQAALRFAKDRDLGGLEATMARLDAEAAAAVVRPSRIPTAAEARAYLEPLPELWAKTSDAGRHAIAEAAFERIDVLGATDFTFTLIAAARARRWDAAFGPGVLRLQGRCGRGETPSPDPAPEEGVLSTKEGQSGRGERHRPATIDHRPSDHDAPRRAFGALRSAAARMTRRSCRRASGCRRKGRQERVGTDPGGYSPRHAGGDP